MWIVKRAAPRLMALTAMLLALGSTGGGEGVVLCFGGDGHVAIERRGSEGCAAGGVPGSHEASATAVPVSSSHCGPCVDVALNASLAAEGVAASKRPGTPPATIPIAALTRPILRLRVATSYWYSTGFISEEPHTIVIRC